MTDSNGGTGDAATLPAVTYDPKAVFFAEWARIVEPWLEGEGREDAWRQITAEDKDDHGPSLANLSEEAYRNLSRGMAHAWRAMGLLKMSEDATSQASAHKTIGMAELRRLVPGNVCASYDLATGTIRACKHEHDEAPSKPAFKLIDIPIGNAAIKTLIEMISKAGASGRG